MKMKLVLVTISAAALAVSADSHAMIRAGRAKIARPAAQLNARMANIMPRVLKFKAQGLPQITKETLYLKAKKQELETRALKQAELTRNVEMADQDLRYAKSTTTLGMATTAGLLSLPAFFSLDPSFVGETFSIVTNITNIVTVPILAGLTLLSWNCMNKAATSKMSAEQALEAFVKEQKAEANFVPDIK